jgi:hypothetical protein
MNDPVLEAINQFMDAVDTRLQSMRTEIADFRSATTTALEQRSAPVKGDAGEPGAAGPAGKDGAQGPKGDTGPAGERGPQGEKGERGADGVQGRDGAPSTVPGPQGEKGERGADGIATRAEIESIVEQRVADINVRTFADVYQGVYENGRLYTRGVLTTWGGHMWLSLADTQAKPGESPDWKMVVKAGRDGRK